MSRAARIRVSKAAAGALDRGHPWLLAEGTPALPAGQLVQIEDGQGRDVAWGLADEGTIVARILGRGRAPARPIAAVVLDRVQRADAVRTRLIDADTDAYRVINGAGDGLPGLVVDRYGELAVVRLYSAAWEARLEEVVAAVSRLPWVVRVWRRFGVERVDGRTGGEALFGDAPEQVVRVRESGMTLLVRPHVGQKTGMFLDQREHRALIRRWASGRVTANLFAYTGGFSVAAALGGAARVTTVDLAPEAVEDARENFRLNGIDPDAHVFEVADAFAWRPPGQVDLLIVDPPSLARGKRSEGAARSAYRRLHARLGGSVGRDGLLATSSCTARLPFEEWCRAVEEGLAASGAWSWHHRSTEPPDHPVAAGHHEAHYLKFGLLRRR